MFLSKANSATFSLVSVTLLFRCYVEGISNHTVPVVTMEIEPYVMRTSFGYEDYLPDLMQKLAQFMGLQEIKYEFHVVKDGKYGMKRRDGSWDGIVGELMRGEALCKKASNHRANHTPGNVQFYIVTTWETPGNHWC